MLNGANRRLRAKSDSFVLGDVIGELARSDFDAGAVVSLTKIGNHGASSVAGASVVDDGLEAVTDFGPIFAVVGRDEEEDAVVLVLLSDAERFENLVGELLDRFAIEGIDGDDGELRPGFLLELEAERVDAGFGIEGDDAGKIGDVIGGMDVLWVFGAGGSGEKEKKKRRQKEGGKEANRGGCSEHLRGL